MRHLANSDWQPIAVALAAVLLLAAFAAGSRAQAKTQRFQTVPTPTPRVIPPPQAPRVDPSGSREDASQASLALVQRASTSDGMIGESVAFTISLSNTSNAPLSGIILSTLLDPVLNALEIRATQGAARVVGQGMFIDLGDLYPGQRAMIYLRAEIRASAQDGHVILNQFTAQGEDILVTSNTVAIGLPPNHLPATGMKERLP